MSVLRDKQKNGSKASQKKEVASAQAGKIKHSENKESAEDSKSKKFKSVLLFTTIPVRLFAGPIFGFFLGHFIDSKLNTSPVFSIVLLLFGFVLGVIQLIILSKR